MTHTRANLPLLAAGLSLSLMLSACTPAAPGDTTTEHDTAGSCSVGTDPDRDMIARYEALITQLREQLLQERADRYLSDATAGARIAELERALTLAADTAPSESPAQPVSADTQPTAVSMETAAEAALPSASLDFSVSDGEVTVTRCTVTRGGSGCVTVPACVGGLPVTRIAEGAFRDTDITSVTLPDTLTEIGWFAFTGCAQLGSVTLPASVSTIGYGAFDGCPLLTVTAPPGSYAAQWAQSFGIPTA